MRIPFKLLLGAISTTWLLIYGAGTVAACSVERLPVPWVLTTPQFDTSALPAGVTISYQRTETWGDGELSLRNDATTPLYVLAKAADFDGMRPNADVPAGLVATLMVTQDGWSERRGDQWVALDGEDAPRRAWTATLSALDIDTHSESYQQRPDDYVLPPAQRTAITLVYDDQVIAVPTTIEYALNPAAEPQPAPRINPCDPPPRASRYIPLIALAATATVGLVGVWWYRMRQLT